MTEAAHVFVEEITLAGIRAAGAAYARADLPRRLARYHGDKTDSVFQAWHDGWRRPSSSGWNIEAELPHINAPPGPPGGRRSSTAAGAGERSSAASAARKESPAAARLGHTPHLEAPERVVEAVAGFLARHVGEG